MPILRWVGIIYTLISSSSWGLENRRQTKGISRMERHKIETLKDSLIWSIVFNSSLWWLICLEVLPITESWILKSTTTVLLSVFLFSSINLCFIYLGALILSAYIFIMLYLPGELTRYHYIMTFFIPFDSFESFCLILMFLYVYIYVYIPFFNRLSVSLNLTWVSYRQNLVGSSFFLFFSLFLSSHLLYGPY